MSDAILIRPLAASQIAQAFPVLSVVDPQLTAAQWQDYAGAVVENGAAGGRTGILTAQSEEGCIYALSGHTLKPDLHEGRILEIENFAVAALLGNLVPARLLLEGLETLARERECSCVVLSLLNPLMRKWLRERSNPAIELFRSAGFRGEQLRLRKCFQAAGATG
ncbi:MAG TPA: hypothetical protein VLL72_00240 [Kiloniellales bacterium]|nr:hypothetical protein [Kiloniellales bacterium]